MLNESGKHGAAGGSGVKQARGVFAALPGVDAVAAVKALTEALENIRSADGLPLNDRYAEIQRLDVAAVEHTRALLREYLSTARQKKLREGELWNGAYGYWRELAAAYLRCVQCYAADPRGAVTFKLEAPVALTRALRALRRQLQWTRIRYATPGKELWLELANLYSAVASSNVDGELLIYPGEITTVKREFLKAMMQSALSCEDLQPQAQDIASAVVSHFAPQFVFSMKPGSGCTHWFDSLNPNAPVRVTRTPLPDSAVYYFGAGPAVEALEKAIAQLQASRELPPGLALDGIPDPVYIKSILEHVHRDWSGKTQSRAQERQKVNARITVVPGFKDIMRTLEFAVSDSLDFTGQPTAESWVVNNVSKGGYGAVIPSVAGDWVEVGGLVGVEGDVPRAWRVGVIRRVQSVEGNQQRVGVQLLSQNATLVRMRREDEQQAQVGISQRIPLDFAILLSDEAATQAAAAEVEVLVRSGSFTNADNVYMMAKDQLILLRPKAVVERSATCERVAFKVVKVES